MKNLLLSTFMVISVMALGQEIPEKSLNLVQVSSKDFEEAPRKVYIKNFKAFYQMIAEAETTSYGGRQLGGGSYTGNATARLAVGVEGVDPEDLQAITNELYNEYVESLKSLGFEVYTSEDLGQIEFFEEWELLKGPRINEDQIKGSLMVIPDGFSYYVKGVNRKGKEKTGGFMSGVTGDAGDLYTSSIYGPVPKLSGELDDMMIVEVTFNIPSIYLDPKSNFARAKVKGGAYLRMQNAKVAYISGKLKKPGVASPKAGMEMSLQKPVLITGVFGEQNFNAVATKSRTTVPSYAAFFTVQNNTMELTNTIKCEGEDYKREVKKAMKAYLDLSLEKLQIGLNGDKIK